MGKQYYPPRAVTFPVEVSLQAHADLKRLVDMGLFGFTVGDCAARFIDQALQQKAVEGWLAMPAFVETKPRTAPRKGKPDFVAELTAELTKKNPLFPAMVAAAKKRRAR